MRFISKSASYSFVIRHDEQALQQFSSGVVHPRTVRAAFVAEFQQGMCRPAEAYAAMRRFAPNGWGSDDLGAPHPFGAAPLNHPSQFTDQNGRIAVETVAFDPRSRFSVFDTAGIGDAELRVEAEQKLTENQGEDYFLFEEAAAPAPWPSYDKTKSADAIARMTRDSGLDPAGVAAYEQAHQNRADVLSKLAKLASDDAQTAADDAALSVAIQ